MSSSLLSDVAPPDPIPNSEVKRVSADNTCSARNREDRSRLGDSGAVFLMGENRRGVRHEHLLYNIRTMGENGIFMDYVEAQYPGYRGGHGWIENLASYRENVHWFKPGEVERSNTLQFDIERHVEWDDKYNLLPFTYSAMANAAYPVPSRVRDMLHLPSGPRREEFETIAQKLPGFKVLERFVGNPQACWYENSALGILVDWNVHSDRINSKNIGIAAVYFETVPTLEVLIQQILPNVVKYFNIINPTRQLNPVIVNKTIALARQRDIIIPKRRVSR